MLQRKIESLRYVILFIVIYFSASPLHADPQYVYNSIPATPVVEIDVPLDAGTIYIFKTESVCGFKIFGWCVLEEWPGDPILHLWDPTTQTELGHDDDGGPNQHARLVVNPTRSDNYVLILHAAHTGFSGRVQITAKRINQSGNIFKTEVFYGGTTVSVPDGANLQYEVAFAPGGARDSKLFGMDCSSTIKKIDDDGGVGLASKIQATPGLCSVLIGSTGRWTSGSVNLYVNDFMNDADGDGLGASLEAALGTCDTNTIPECEGVYNTADTDHDGLSDAAEVFGVDDENEPQYLPAWGANPRHKDVFVEIDYREDFSEREFTTNPFNGDDAISAQAYFDLGTVADLRNPDGIDGVSLHLDIGHAVLEPEHTTLYGDWGGANSVPMDIDMTQLANMYRSEVRRGLFHYGVLVPGNGGGQGYRPGDIFSWSAPGTTTRYVNSFAHELGHNLNLLHSGHSSWGNVNCKPHYRSVMNYAYQYRVNGYSQGSNQNTILSPDAVVEADGLQTDPAFLTGDPYHLEISGTMVDWNADSFYAYGPPVRAPVTWATGSGCSAFTQNAMVLQSQLPAITPDILRANGNYIYTFFISSDNTIRYRHSATSGVDRNGSCPGGNTIGSTCMTWEQEQLVTTDYDAKGLSVIEWKDKIFIAYTTSNNTIRVFHANGYAPSTGLLINWSDEIELVNANTEKAPELAVIHIRNPFCEMLGGMFGGNPCNGNPQPPTLPVMAVFYLDRSTQEYKWHMGWEENSFTAIGSYLPNITGSFKGNLSPSLVTWPSPNTDSSAGTTCGVFPDLENRIRLYCFNLSEAWAADVTSTAFEGNPPVTHSKPSLVYKLPRHSEGYPAISSISLGQLWLITVNDKNVPRMHISSTNCTACHNPGVNASAGFRFTRGGHLGNWWTKLHDNSGVTLYEDNELSALKGVMLRKKDDGGELNFLPLADGSFRADLKDGSDFQIMERGICLGIRGAAYCGSAANSFWGY